LAVMLSNNFVSVARGESWRDSTARPWNLEAEFPLGGKGHPSRAINRECRKPFAQPRSSTTRKEHAVL
jgi:hypothetical protein